MPKTTRVGVAWKRQTREGKNFLSVIITNPTGPDFHFTIWPVQEKQGESSPDYTVTKSADERPAAKPRPAESDDFPDDVPAAADDVPF